MGLGAALPAIVALPGAWLLAQVGPRMSVALPATAVVLVLWLAAVTCATWFSLALLAALVDRLHRDATSRPPASGRPAATEVPASRLRVDLLATAALAALATVGGWWLLRTQAHAEDVEITAHRMGACDPGRRGSSARSRRRRRGRNDVH